MRGIFALVAANIFVFVFNFSWGPAIWVLLGEMFPNQIRGSAMGISGCMLWVTNFGITMTFPMMLTGIGLGGAYSIYALFAVISFFFVWAFAKETKGRELESMEG
jgi:SP family sugar:H+ symporter-like MFS transporter